MWNTTQIIDVHLSHDMQCARCGHDVHTFLACGPDCVCDPVVMPGGVETAAASAPFPAAYRQLGGRRGWALPAVPRRGDGRRRYALGLGLR
jgi:hypothetical protein